jgi:hypothetical protein
VKGEGVCGGSEGMGEKEGGKEVIRRDEWRRGDERRR